jgi:hypothetical protein
MVHFASKCNKTNYACQTWFDPSHFPLKLALFVSILIFTQMLQLGKAHDGLGTAGRSLNSFEYLYTEKGILIPRCGTVSLGLLSSELAQRQSA